MANSATSVQDISISMRKLYNSLTFWNGVLLQWSACLDSKERLIERAEDYSSSSE